MQGDKEAGAPASSGVSHSSAPPPALPKPIHQCQPPEFLPPVGARGWRPTPPCVSGAARQRGDAPGKILVEKRLRKRALIAQREQKKHGSAVAKQSSEYACFVREEGGGKSSSSPPRRLVQPL